MKMLTLLTCATFLTSCTYSVTLVHTDGTASDVVDTDQKSDAKVDPTLTIPLM